MPTCTFEYAIIRVVPRVERGEFVNVGVLLSCPQHSFLQAHIEPDWPRLKAFAPTLNCDLIGDYLRLIPIICAGGPEAGPLGQMPQRGRFHWLVAPRSTMIQLSPVHSGLCDDPEVTLVRLLDSLVRAL